MSIQDKIKRFSPKQQTYLMLLIPLAILALFVNYVYLPGNRDISELEATVQQNESGIAKSQIMQRKLKELKTEDARLQLELKRATERLPSAAEGAGAPDTISGMAKESGLSVKSVNPGSRKTGMDGLYAQTPITIEVNGGYHELGKFMEKLDSTTRMMTVSEMDITSGTVSGLKMSLPVKIIVLAYTAGGGK